MVMRNRLVSRKASHTVSRRTWADPETLPVEVPVLFLLAWARQGVAVVQSKACIDEVAAAGAKPVDCREEAATFDCMAAARLHTEAVRVLPLLFHSSPSPQSKLKHRVASDAAGEADADCTAARYQQDDRSMSCEV